MGMFHKGQGFTIGAFTLYFCGLILVPALGATAPWPALPTIAPAPPSNPTTPEKVSLGQKLFFDPRLSIDGTVSCNSCEYNFISHL